MKLNLGCGEDIREGYENLDNNPFNNKVIPYDLNNHLPYNDDSIDYIHCEHLLSYLDNPADFLNIIHWKCKKNAKIKLIVSHFSLAMNYAELRKRTSGFSYFMLGHEEWNNEFYNKFEVVKKKINFTRINHRWLNYIFNPLINTFPVLYERFFCYIFPSSEIIFDLKVIKDGGKA